MGDARDIRCTKQTVDLQCGTGGWMSSNFLQNRMVFNNLNMVMGNLEIKTTEKILVEICLGKR